MTEKIVILVVMSIFVGLELVELKWINAMTAGFVLLLGCLLWLAKRHWDRYHADKGPFF
jgi:hypothetical protein